MRVKEGETTVAEYEYDPLGRRVRKTVGSAVTRYVYDGQNIIEEYVWTQVEPDVWEWTLDGEYVHGLGIDDVLTLERSSTTWFYLHDGSGSVTELLDDAGDLAQAYEYDAWGDATIYDPDHASGNTYLYTGREWDGAVGLYYYRARHYAPQLGRFIQADPAGYVDGPNVYVYVDNGPTYFADPTGSVKVSVTNEIRLEKKKFVETWKYRYSDGSCYRHVLSEDHSDRLLAKTKSTMIGLVETRDDGARFFRDIDIHIDVPVNHASGNWTYDWWQLVIDARPVVGEKWTVNGGCDECVAGHVAWKAIMGKVASQRTISVQIGYGPIKMTGGLEASADIIMAQISYWHEFKICTSDAEEQVARISNIDAESAYFTDFWVDTSEHLISHNNFVKKRVQRYGWKKLYVRE